MARRHRRSPIYILLNGAFGVGKSVVARQLRSLLGRAVIFDPELIGMLLQRWPGNGDKDFQDIPLWRRLAIAGAKLTARVSPTVIIPMAFTNRGYLEEITSGLSASGEVRHFCLTAPLAVVQQRLADRGEPEHEQRFAWVHRRARECCEMHGSPAFATLVPTEGLDPATVAQQIRDQLP